jgi:hypothetical protein
MPNVYQPSLIQIRPQYDQSDADLDNIENVTWWLGTFAVPLSEAQLIAIAGVFDNSWKNVWLAFGATSRHYKGSIVTDWSSNTGLQYSSVGTFAPVVGTEGAALPVQACALISLAIGERYRGGHGRVYLPALGNSTLESDYQLEPSVSSALLTAYANMQTAMAGISSADGGAFVQSVYRYRNDPATASVHGVVAFTVQQKIATQRRRLRKAAHH